MAFSASYLEFFQKNAFKISPYFLMFVFFILEFVSIPFSGGLKAPFFLMAIYYWSIHRPSLIPVWFCFACGLVIDLGGGVVGVNALMFVLFRWLILRQRRFLMGQPFLSLVLGFAIVCTVYSIVQWGISGLPNMMWPPVTHLAVSVLYGVVFSPMFLVFLQASHRIYMAGYSRSLDKV